MKDRLTSPSGHPRIERSQGVGGPVKRRATTQNYAAGAPMGGTRYGMHEGVRTSQEPIAASEFAGQVEGAILANWVVVFRPADLTACCHHIDGTRFQCRAGGPTSSGICGRPRGAPLPLFYHPFFPPCIRPFSPLVSHCPKRPCPIAIVCARITPFHLSFTMALRLHRFGV